MVTKENDVRDPYKNQDDESFGEYFSEIITLLLNLGIVFACVYLFKELICSLNDVFFKFEGTLAQILETQIIPTIIILLFSFIAFFKMRKNKQIKNFKK